MGNSFGEDGSKMFQSHECLGQKSSEVRQTWWGKSDKTEDPDLVVRQ